MEEEEEEDRSQAVCLTRISLFLSSASLAPPPSTAIVCHVSRLGARILRLLGWTGPSLKAIPHEMESPIYIFVFFSRSGLDTWTYLSI